LFNEPNEKVQLFESIDKFTRDDFDIAIPTVPSEKTLKIRQRFQKVLPRTVVVLLAHVRRIIGR